MVGNARFYIKVHENPRGRVVAVCDKTLLGKIFREGEQTLDLKKYAAFYKGDEVDEKEVMKKLKKFSSLNLVGRDAVELAIRAGIVLRSQVREVAKVPQVQVYKI